MWGDVKPHVGTLFLPQDKWCFRSIKEKWRNGLIDVGYIRIVAFGMSKKIFGALQNHVKLFKSYH